MYDNRYGIVPPEIQRGDFDVPGNVLNAIQNKPYNGFKTENPIDHLLEFERACSLTKKVGVSDDALMLRLFPFSLSGAAAQWEHNLTPGTITTWEQCRTAFLTEFYTPNRTAKIRNQITSFAQHGTESFAEAWTRFKKYQLECPHHGIPQDSLLSTFYRGLTSENRRMLDTASNGNFLMNTVDNGLALIQNMANSDTIYGADNDRTDRRPIDGEYSRNKDIKELKEKIDRLLVAQQKGYEINMVSDDPTIQVEEASYVQNNYRNQQPYAPFRNHPNLSYRSNNVENPQDQIQPPFQPQQPRPYAPRPQYNNNYRPNYQQPQPQPQQAPPPDMNGMLQQIMKNQEATTAELSVMRNEFNKRIDSVQADVNSKFGDLSNKFENLNSRVQYLEGHITNASNTKVTGQFPGKAIQNPKEYSVQAINVSYTHTDTVAEDSKFLEGEASLKDKADSMLDNEVKAEIVEEEEGKIPEYDHNLKDTILLRKEDPGKFTLPCSIKGMNFPRCVCDTGAGISTISFSTSQALGFKDLEPCEFPVRLADNSLGRTHGIIKNVPIKVGPKTIYTDLVVIDVKEGSTDSILLGRPFLKTARVVIDMVNETIELDSDGNFKLVFSSDGKLLYSQKIKSEEKSSMRSSFLLEPTEDENGIKEYIVLGGRTEAMPHEKFLNPKPTCTGPFGIGRKTPNGKIAMTASLGTLLPLKGRKVQFYLMEPENPNPRTPEPQPAVKEEKVENDDGREKKKKYVPPHLRNRIINYLKEEEEVIWDTLGESRGHYDYMVKYSAPAWVGMDTKDIKPTGWDDEPERTSDPLPEPSL